MFKISQEDRQKLLKYLQDKQYAKALTLIALIVGLKPVENSKEDKKKPEKVVM